MEFGNQLAQHLHLEGSIRRVPKYQLRSRRHHCPKHSKFSGHFSVVKGNGLHPHRQVIPHPWWANNGEIQLRALGLQKGELLELLLVLPQTPSTPTRLCMLALKEGDLLDKALYVFKSRRQCRGFVCFPPHHILR
jgi:hypothetical protein